jgi:hypothetical protein
MGIFIYQDGAYVTIFDSKINLATPSAYLLHAFDTSWEGLPEMDVLFGDRELFYAYLPDVEQGGKGQGAYSYERKYDAVSAMLGFTKEASKRELKFMKSSSQADLQIPIHILLLLSCHESLFRFPRAGPYHLIPAVATIVTIANCFGPVESAAHIVRNQIVDAADAWKQIQGVQPLTQLFHPAFVNIDLEGIGVYLPEPDFVIIFV